MYKYNRKNSPTPNIDNLFGSSYEIIDTYMYPVVLAVKKSPSTSTMVVVTTADANWTAVITGLSNVMYWKANEQDGNNFRYAYVAVPGVNYCTAFGMLEKETALEALYVQRIGATNVSIALEYWTA
jgi:hypothetical protein